MTPYERLIEKVVDSDIIFEQHASIRIPSASLEIEKQYAIFIHNGAFKSDVERCVALAHEKGHCDNGAVHTATANFSERHRCEYRANKRAVQELVSFDEYSNAMLAGIFDTTDQAEYWNVSAEFVPIIHNVYERTRWNDVQLLKESVEKIWDT